MSAIIRPCATCSYEGVAGHLRYIGTAAPHADAQVRGAVDAIESDSLFVSVLSIGEIAKGIALLRDGQRRRALQTWLQEMERFYGDRLLPVDVETSHIWGELTAAAQQAGRTVSASDGLIAATARRHGLYVMTRNISDFEPTGVMLINPWPALGKA